MGDVHTRRVVHRLLGVRAADPAVLVVLIQHRRAAGTQSQRRVPLPPGGEPDSLGELDVAQPPGEQHHAAAAFHGGELLVVAGHHDLAAPVVGQGQDRGHVGQRHHAGLVEDEQ